MPVPNPQCDPVGYRLYWVRRCMQLGWCFLPLDGKKPFQHGWQAAPRPSLDACLNWARSRNVGLRTGSASGIFVIDLDGRPRRDLAYLPDTPTVRTGSGHGRHLYFEMPGVPLGNSVSRLGRAVDTRGEGGQVVFVPNKET